MPCRPLFRQGRIALLAMLVLCAAGSRGLAQQQWRAEDSIDTQAVREAIKQGVEALWKMQRPNGSFPGVKQQGSEHTVGATAQAAYALLACGVPVRDPRMMELLENIAAAELNTTYDLSFRILALASAHREEPNGNLSKIVRDDCRQLVHSMAGDYGYTYPAKGEMPHPERTWIGSSDASNSQYALLAVWMAVEYCAAEIPAKWWQLHKKYWIELQHESGGWGYTPKKIRPQPYLSMTAAGLASVFVCTDHLDADRFLSCGRNPSIASIDNGLAWMEKHFAREVGKKWPYYTLYGVERVGLASGYKFFGGVDWYKKGVEFLLANREEDGSWKRGGWGANSNTATCYALLFLRRGLNPVLINKLRFKGDWNNRPRDLANFTHWMTNRFEDSVQWQIVNLDSPVKEWHDAPILYISGAAAPQLNEAEIDKIRDYVHQGGRIFSVTECNGRAFSGAIREIYGQLFGQYELTRAAPGDPLYSCYEKLPAGRPILYKIHNGLRTLAVHTDVDLSRTWQGRRTRTGKRLFEVGANVSYHLTAGMKLRPRGSTHWPQEPEVDEPKGRLRIALLDHGPNYNAEPLALERLARLAGHLDRIEVEVLEPVSIEDLEPSGVDLAVWTGQHSFKLTDAQRQVLGTYAEAGGTLLVTPLGGDREFYLDARKAIDDIFEPSNVMPLPMSHPILAEAGIEKLAYRGSAQRAGTSMRMVAGAHGPSVLLTNQDILAGLVGYPSGKIDGYAPASAVSLMRGVLTHLAKSR